MIELIVGKSAVADFGSCCWVDEQEFVDDAKCLGVVLLIPVDSFQVVKHPR